MTGKIGVRISTCGRDAIRGKYQLGISIAKREKDRDAPSAERTSGQDEHSPSTRPAKNGQASLRVTKNVKSTEKDRGPRRKTVFHMERARSKAKDRFCDFAFLCSFCLSFLHPKKQLLPVALGVLCALCVRLELSPLKTGNLHRRNKRPTSTNMGLFDQGFGLIPSILKRKM